MPNRNLSPVILLGGLSVNLNHLKKGVLENIFLHHYTGFGLKNEKTNSQKS